MYFRGRDRKQWVWAKTLWMLTQLCAKPLSKPTASSARVLPSTSAVAPPATFTGQFQWPVRGSVVKRFGVAGTGDVSDGIKIAVPLDTPVKAAADGVVAYVGSDIPALGGVIILRHGSAYLIKYTQDGGSITVSLESDAERARISVRDTGAGIEPSLLPSLFAKYHRLPGQATRTAGGTGLGLLIAKEIVEGHGGRISVTSTGVPGEGTSFVVEVPLTAPLAA